MASTLGDAEVRRIAVLAHLELSDEEVRLFARQLAEILSYADALRTVDTTGVEPTSHPLTAAPVWREDEPAASLDRATILEQAPQGSKAAGLFTVPKVI